MKVFCKKATAVVIQGRTYNIPLGVSEISNPIHAEMLVKSGVVERTGVRSTTSVLKETPIEETPIEETPIEETPIESIVTGKQR